MPSLVRRTGRKTLPVRHPGVPISPGHGAVAGRVLVADPCTDTRETTAELLRVWGYAVRTAANGPEALEAVPAYRPDVVLMELALPLLDGLQVAVRMREWAGGSAPLLVAVTGYGTQRDRARSRQAGFDCHLVKPVCPEVVRMWLAANCVPTGG
jgi:CheY-like chemotaxis protein